MSKAELAALSRDVGTPAYVFDEALFHARVQQVHNAFGAKVGLCYSIKANPFLLAVLPESFQSVEVCSPGELNICKRLHIAPERILFTGVNKTETSVFDAIEYGVRDFSAESPAQIALLQHCAEKRGVQLSLLVRLTAGSAFGMDRADVLDYFTNRDRFANLVPVGLHYFSGTMKKKCRQISDELTMLSQFMTELETQTGCRLQKLEYGTGMAAEYFSDTAEQTDAALLEEVASLIREMGERISLTVEMGRFFAAPCGYYFSRIADTKRNGTVNYAILDGGIHQLHYDGQLLGMQPPQMVVFPERADGLMHWTLCGSLCTTADVLARNVLMSDLQPGDTVVFCRAGAYSLCEGPSLLLSRDLPAVYLRRADGSLHLARERYFTDILNTPQ